MQEHLERYYKIDGTDYWEGDLKKVYAGTATFYIYNKHLYTRPELERLCTVWGQCCNINGHRYTREQLESWLSIINAKPARAYRLSGITCTDRSLERALNRFKHDEYSVGVMMGTGRGKDVVSDKESECSEVDLPAVKRRKKEDMEKEIVEKVLASLKSKIRTVKRHKMIEAEVKRLKRLLAEKEADLAECERIMQLEVSQVNTN
ncbi:uncharacterized protein H6S33_012103 [Morchella sextelata]|uniref:uncharacterized protein n=1 Tax=Morchella sextelata TaxID=1174677 RepID=UPI001D03C380|nr:uncharacterized protein H6S33_012103 [Morchella sextelata]KAH0610576.1 hypothetical protein H6S33_012103 [Morchella sextelata]